MWYPENAMSAIARTSSAVSRSLSAENFTGEKGRGGMATEGAGAYNARELGQGWKVSPCVVIKAGETFTAADIEGPGMIRHIWMTDSSKQNRKLILRMYWDGSETPSVEAPLGDFFACADCLQYSQLTSAAVCVNPKRAFNCYWEMPFRKRCRMTVENIFNEDITLFYQIDYLLTEVPENAAYFHAQFRRTNPVPYKEVYTILDNVRGNGQYVGTYLYWSVNSNCWWGEGEIKFYLDGDDEFPTICGTGTEDYFCGAYNFDNEHRYERFATPYTGMIPFAPDGLYRANQRFSLYRWHLTDPIRFAEDLRVTIQALGWRSGGRYLPLQDDISSTAFFYLDHPSESMPALPERDFLEIN